jgi:hypothetical protein
VTRDAEIEKLEPWKSVPSTMTKEKSKKLAAAASGSRPANSPLLERLIAEPQVAKGHKKTSEKKLPPPSVVQLAKEFNERNAKQSAAAQEQRDREATEGEEIEVDFEETSDQETESQPSVVDNDGANYTSSAESQEDSSPSEKGTSPTESENEKISSSDEEAESSYGCGEEEAEQARRQASERC